MPEDISDSQQSQHAPNMELLNAILADYTAIRAEVVKLVTDMATRIANHNTLIAKLNADGGVTDADYAAAGAMTAAAPAAVTVVA